MSFVLFILLYSIWFHFILCVYCRASIRWLERAHTHEHSYNSLVLKLLSLSLLLLLLPRPSHQRAFASYLSPSLSPPSSVSHIIRTVYSVYTQHSHFISLFCIMCAILCKTDSFLFRRVKQKTTTTKKENYNKNDDTITAAAATIEKILEKRKWMKKSTAIDKNTFICMRCKVWVPL